MKRTTKLNIDDKLPLTCTRTGTCCHGKQVLLTPWELVCLARAKKNTSREFRDLYCEFGGIRLRFNGKAGWKSQKACSQYVENYGCSVHSGRPLACRLYPLGRHIQSNEVKYIYEGDEFPCMDGCPEVSELPHMSVGEYLKGQQTVNFERAQDEYLEIMQNLAEVALVLLLDTGLAHSGDKATLPEWRKLGKDLPEKLAEKVGQEWLDRLILPDIFESLEDPVLFARQHNDMLQSKAQEEFGLLQTSRELHNASVLMMGLALLLAHGLGADPESLAEHWISIAKDHGAIDA